MKDPLEGDEFFEELAAELRSRAGRELRDETEEVERLVALGRRRARSLSDAALAMMQRGDLVVVQAGDNSYTGRFQHVSSSLALLSSPSGLLAVHLSGPVALRIKSRARKGGVAPSRAGPASFHARLAEYEQTAERVEVVAPTLGLSVIGRITVAARDHVIFSEAAVGDWFVPIEAIAVVIPRP